MLLIWLNSKYRSFIPSIDVCVCVYSSNQIENEISSLAKVTFGIAMSIKPFSWTRQLQQAAAHNRISWITNSKWMDERMDERTQIIIIESKIEN